MHYSLIEYKLRKYLYLGNENSLYVPPSLRSIYWGKKDHDKIIGVRIIGNIVNKKKTEDINSIVSIILKIKKEDKLYDDRLMIFALAVCARFNLNQCAQMVSDAYRAVSTICTDGLKLLMFVKFCNTASQILKDEGYLLKGPSKFGAGLRRALKDWYLKRDPLLTIEQIIRHKRYDGWSHSDVMKLIHIHSDDQSRHMIIVYTLYGMKRVEKLFELKLKNVDVDDINETFENKESKFIYNFLVQVNNLYKMDDKTIVQNEIEFKRFGHLFEIIPHKILINPKVLTSLAMHMPLKTLLDNTFFFAKQKLFYNSTPDLGLWVFISRFNNTDELEKSKIHPIESFLEYVKYSRTSMYIMKLQNDILKKQSTCGIELSDDNKFITSIEMSSHKNSNSNFQTEISNNTSLREYSSQSTINHESKLFQLEPLESGTQNSNLTEDKKVQNLSLNSVNKKDLNKFKQQSTESEPEKFKNDQILNETSSVENLVKTNNHESNMEPVIDKIQFDINDDINQNKSNGLIIKPPPKKVEQLLSFLSEDLLKKTLENLQPSGRRILIAYDNRLYVTKNTCAHERLVSIHEAITLIILSLIYPGKCPKKPTIHSFATSEKQCNNEVNIDYNQPRTFANVESILFPKPVSTLNSDIKDVPEVYPLTTMKWAKETNKEYDIFVFLGTHKMNFRNIRKALKEYRAFMKKKVQIIVCCLNGKHYEQKNLSREHMLFISGFDKNVGKLINSFINEEF